MENVITPIPLDQGLDLISPASNKPAGSMEYCLNYEIADRLGYQRIGGIERFDGHTTGNIDAVHEVIVEGDTAGDIGMGDLISMGQYGYPFGVVLDKLTGLSPLGVLVTKLTYKPLYTEQPPDASNALQQVHTFTSSVGFVLVQKYNTDQSGFTDVLQTTILGYSTFLRSRVIQPHAAVVGLHYMDDTLYAVIDDLVLQLSGATALVAGATFSYQGKSMVVNFKEQIGGIWFIFARPNTPGASWTYGVSSTIGGGINGTLLRQASKYASLYRAIDEYASATGVRGWFHHGTDTDPALPGSLELLENTSRYQFLTYNFLAGLTTKRIYGVNGAGRAFFFSAVPSEPLTIIQTQVDATKDKPRHIAVHRNHLALGFKQGSVQLSVVGDPTDYSGLNGASEFGIGDEVTGLLEVQGTTLAIMCKSKIDALEGASILDFYTKTLAPNVGVIEYSVADMGEPVFATSTGICSLSQATEYGDFLMGSLSYKINNFVLPKLDRPRIIPDPSQTYTLTPSDGVACAFAVRSKNQYRLYFNDGDVITGTKTDEGFKWTTQHLTNASGVNVVPLAWCSQVAANSREMLFVSNLNFHITQIWGPIDPNDGARLVETVPNDFWVYKIDEGWGFDGIKMPHVFETSYMFGDEMSVYHNVSKIRAHGLTKGRASIVVRSAGIDRDYDFIQSDSNGPISRFQVAYEDISLPRKVADNSRNRRLSIYPEACTNIAPALANTGLGIALRFEDDPEVTLMEPLHNIQVLVLQSIPDGREDS